MVTLLGDAHFWTLRDDVVIKDADMGAFRWVRKGERERERERDRQTDRQTDTQTARQIDR